MKTIALLRFAISMMGPFHTDSQSQAEFSVDAIRLGCSVSFSKQFHAIPEDPLSNPPFDISVDWHCRDGEAITIDKYEINGSSPEVETLFYWQGRNIVMLVKWSVNSQASEYVGDYYKVFAYRYEREGGGGKFKKNETIMKNFPAGFDGRSKNGLRATYPFKNAASIRKRLQTLKINN